MDYDLIIFDCDGTLVDSEYLNNLALIETLNRHGVTQYDMDYALQYFAGGTLSNIFIVIEDEQNITLDRQRFTSEYMDLICAKQKSDLNIVDGALEVVEHCKSMAKICVASNGERDSVLRALSLTGLDSFFPENHVFTKIQVENGKPAPDLFLYAAKQMNVDPSRCLVLEDSPTGVQAGVRAGMDVWGFVGVSHDPNQQKITLKKDGALKVFDDFIHISSTLFDC